jgi:hypothetical protein
MSHTPGPWKKDGAGTSGHVKAIINDGKRATPTVCKYDRDNSGCAVSITDEEIQANGYLLAASPDLLKACKDVLAALEKSTQETGEILWLDHVLPSVHESAMERLQNVIDDAEGKSETCFDCSEKFDVSTGICDHCREERDRIDEAEKAGG